MDLISVIVPVYKVEEYLDRCVESIVNQTYRNLEIILVDDGSPDNCPAMCDAWAAKDVRIKVIHKENGGLSDARNVGLKIASGEYIAFVDSDDWIHSQYVANLHSACVEQGTLLSACDVMTVFEEQELCECDSNVKSNCFSTEEAMRCLTEGQKIRAVAWNKLYHNNLIDCERFPVGRYHEDEFFTYRIVAKAEKVAYVPKPLYYYYQRDGSIMNSVSIKHLDALDAALERLNYLKTIYPSIYKRDKALFCQICVNLYCAAEAIAVVDRDAYKKRIKECRSSVSFSIIELLRYSCKDVVYIVGSHIGIGVFCSALNLKRNKRHE